MLPGNMYLAEELTFQFRGLTQFIYIHVYKKYEVTEFRGVSLQHFIMVDGPVFVLALVSMCLQHI